MNCIAPTSAGFFSKFLRASVLMMDDLISHQSVILRGHKSGGPADRRKLGFDFMQRKRAIDDGASAL